MRTWMSPALVAASTLTLLAGCGSFSGDLGGTLDGVEFDPKVGYWGGPFLVFSADDIDCIDLWWVSKNYDEENPWDRSFSLLQVTFEESDVVAGTFEMSGDAPVSAGLLVAEGDDLFVDEARSGQVIIDDISGSRKVSGSLNLEMVAGQVSGDFKVEQCSNLSSAY